MDLPINERELDQIIFALVNHDELRDKLIIVRSLMKEGKPYKKILRENFGFVA